jgi:hypothetical protein
MTGCVMLAPRATAPRRVPAIPALPALALAVFALLCPPTCDAAGRGGRGGPPGGRRGPVLPTLPDGTPVEPSTYRAETTESAEVLEDGVMDWEVDVVGGSVDRLGGVSASSLDWLHAEVRRGFGDGLEMSARAEAWDQTVVEQGATRQSLPESGYGPTTLTLRERLRAGGSGPAACAGLRVRLPGGANGPGTQVAEGGIFLPVSIPVGRRSRLAAMVEGDLVPDALGTGRHVEGVSSLEFTREFRPRLSARCEAVSVWDAEPGRPWLGSVNAGVSVEPLAHVALTLGASGGTTGGRGAVGCYGRLSVQP